MRPRQQHDFIRESILQLQTAILQAHSTTVLNIPSTVITTQEIDDAGNIWTSVCRTTRQMGELDKHFHVSLKYFKKDVAFYLAVNGIARLVTDPEEIGLLSPLMSEEYKKGKLILCIRVLDAEYHKRNIGVESGPVRRYWNQVSSNWGYKKLFDLRHESMAFA